MELSRIFSVFNKYMIYESTGKQEMLKETFQKRFMGKLQLITAIRSELQKNHTTNKTKNNYNIKNCKRNNYEFVIK